MPKAYDEERNELVIATIALAIMAAICGAIAIYARGSGAAGLLWSLAGIYCLASLNCLARVLWEDPR